MRARITVVAATLAVAGAGGALSHCTGDDHGGDTTDAAPDRRSDVASPDAVSEAGIDGACSVTSDWPGFRRLSEFDPCAPADVLVDPDAGYDMSWTNCDDDAGVVGCKQLVQLAPQVFTYAYAAYDDAGAGRALYLDQGIAPLSNVRQFDIIDLKTNARLGEWRIDADNSNGTQVLLPNATDTTTAFLGWRTSGLFAEFAPAQSLFTNPLTLTPYPSAPGQDINWAISDQVMAFQPFGSPYAICKVAAGTCVPMNIASMAPAVPYLTFAWHDVAFATAEHGTVGWGQEYVIHADGSISLLRSNPTAHVWAMTTDGTTLVWEETYGSTDLNGQQAKYPMHEPAYFRGSRA